MKKIILPFLVFIALLIVQVKSVAQEKSANDSATTLSEGEKSYGLVSANYNSDIVFLGRKSSSRAPYLSAQAGYYHKSGLFINSTVSYLAASREKRIDLFTASGGYDYYKNNFVAGISATAYFFNNKSYTANSALTGYLGAYAGYDFDIVQVYMDGTAYLSNATDFILGLGVSHSFYLADDHLQIAPFAYIYAGTQNYYGDYGNNQRFGRHMLDGGSSQSPGTGMMGGGVFNILDYELSIPVSYTLNKFRFFFIPVYAIPVNAATITNNQDTYKEDITNSFFWSLGVNYKISKQIKQTK